MAHGSILNAGDLDRKGMEIVPAGPTQESLRQTALTRPRPAAILADCPDAADHYPSRIRIGRLKGV